MLRITRHLSKIYHKLRRLPRKGLRRYIVSSKPAGDGVPYIESYKFFSIPGKHVFFGYYDLPQINSSGTKALTLAACKNADPAGDAAEIGCFDLNNGNYTPITSTRAWCRQQSARLRWHPTDQSKILYNDIDGDKYVTKAADIEIESSASEAQPAVIAPALYDISSDFRFGVSVNFARLQRLRPGYGYSVLPDKTANNPAPEDDGVFLVDLPSGLSKLVVSLRELSLADDIDMKCQHYINHVSFCPDGKKFIFFHIAKDSGTGSRRTIKLYLYHTDTGRLELVENDRITSHYCWNGADHLITTSAKDDVYDYSVYDLKNNTRSVLSSDFLKRDGHPSFLSGGKAFVSDTYPDKAGYQKLFCFDTERSKAAVLAEFYHKPVKTGDMRCDLHPRIWEDGNSNKRIITLDTTCSGGTRKIFAGHLGKH